MKTHQKALVVLAGPGRTYGLDELNIALERGWRVVHATAMGGAAATRAESGADQNFAALVIIERAETGAVALQQAEEAEELIEEIVEGDGSSTGVADPRDPE